MQRVKLPELLRCGVVVHGSDEFSPGKHVFNDLIGIEVF